MIFGCEGGEESRYFGVDFLDVKKMPQSHLLKLPAQKNGLGCQSVGNCKDIVAGSNPVTLIADYQDQGRLSALEDWLNLLFVTARKDEHFIVPSQPQSPSVGRSDSVRIVPTTHKIPEHVEQNDLNYSPIVCGAAGTQNKEVSE